MFMAPIRLSDIAREIVRTEFTSRVPTAVAALPSTAFGASWVALNGLSGVIRGRLSSSPRAGSHQTANWEVPPDLHFAENIPGYYQFLIDKLGSEHVFYNLLALGVTAASVGDALGDYAATVGLRQYFADYLKSLQEGFERLPPNDKFIESSRAKYAQWAVRYAKAHRLDVLCQGREKIPKEGPAVLAFFSHDTIFPNFLYPYFDPRVVYVADADNFRDNLKSRRSGFALMGDGFGQGLVDRRYSGIEEEQQKINERNKVLLNQMVENGAIYGNRYAWFPNGMRVPIAEDDEGRQTRSGFFSSVVDLDHPRYYVQSGGVALNAVRLAARVNRPVKLMILTIRGAEFVMPNKSKKPPYIQENGVGKTIIHRVVKVLEVPVPEDDSSKNKRMTAAGLMASFGRQITQIAREDLEIDSYLADVVEDWGRKMGFTGTREKFLERGEKDEGFFLNTDRIRSIPASIPHRRRQREEAIEEHLRLIHSDAVPSKKDLDPFLVHVAKAVVESKEDLYGAR